MDANNIRQTFLDFFRNKGHHIVPSAPMVVKDDPTLMFNNSGMAPFKDLFLGNAPIKHARIADTQKCLRVSGKHNDLEEVGVDTYHHTMFEMLGNWSFGDYFKKDAIAWAWELLTEVYKIDKDRLYVTVFEGSSEDQLGFDQEAFDTWKQFVSEDKILNGNKKDNFWEMGDTGPCGPSSEIHYDGRTEADRKAISGATLVNQDHSQVIEIWNLVFMEFERRADSSLVRLGKQHVDTGMGFERLVRVLQGKQSNYDTDIFSPVINKIKQLSGLNYVPLNEESDKKQLAINIAMRVIADHIRAISFSIADGQLPGSTGAGYVIRRILRRAVRYGYQTLGLKEPFLCKLVPTLAGQMGAAFPELQIQGQLVEKVIKEEESSFYKTLEIGIKRIDQVCDDTLLTGKTIIDGKVAFELYDTYGFPLDLTSLIAKNAGLTIDEEGFERHLKEQKDRSRAAAVVDTEDWVYLSEQNIENKEKETEFVGYDLLESEAKIIRYRKSKTKNKAFYQIVLDRTPFYSESGGQVGDSGVLESINERIVVSDTKKENGVIIHNCEKLPENLNQTFSAKVNIERRILITNNHSATHLLHAALRLVLGSHVEQKGSLVTEDYLRFDFSHFSALSDEEINRIEKLVNSKVRENIRTGIQQMGIQEAKKAGAMALFGEKYGDVVRVVTFDSKYSVELCGGCHVGATGQIGIFKIVSEGAVAAGIRRIEAITSVRAEEYFSKQEGIILEIKTLLKNPSDPVKSLNVILQQQSELQKQLQVLYKEKALAVKKDLIASIVKKGDLNFISASILLESPEEIKNMLFELRNEVENLFCVITAVVNDKPSVSVIISDSLVKDRDLNAGKIVRELAKEINGGGGGQAFYAQAGGSKPEGLEKVLEKASSYID